MAIAPIVTAESTPWRQNDKINELVRALARFTTGVGDPESVITAPVGTLYLRTDGGAGSTLYVKESDGTGNTGWAAK